MNKNELIEEWNRFDRKLLLTVYYTNIIGNNLILILIYLLFLQVFLMRMALFTIHYKLVIFIRYIKFRAFVVNL